MRARGYDIKRGKVEAEVAIQEDIDRIIKVHPEVKELLEVFKKPEPKPRRRWRMIRID